MPTKIWYYEESPCEVPAQKFEGFSNRQPPKCKRYCYPRQISLSFLSHFKWLRLASKWLKIHRFSKILKFKYFYHQLFFFLFVSQKFDILYIVWNTMAKISKNVLSCCIRSTTNGKDIFFWLMVQIDDWY